MEELADPRILDPRFAHRVPVQDQNAGRIHEMLMSKGAPEVCYVMGEGALDRREMGLREALDHLVGASFGNVISCVPGRLAYFGTEGPNERYILER